MDKKIDNKIFTDQEWLELNSLPKTKTEAKNCNSKFYFTGNPCSKGHISPRYASIGHCLMCDGINYKFECNNQIEQTIIENFPELMLLPRTRKEAKNLGINFYFTAKECKRGHIDKRYTNSSECKTCKYQNSRRLEKEYYKNEEYKEHRRQTNLKWREEHRDQARSTSAKWQNKNKEKINKRTSNFLTNKYHNDKLYQLNVKIFGSLRYHLKNYNENSYSKYEEVIGYSIHQLRNHLQSQFRDGMSWENYAKHWNIDHKKPISKCLTVEETWNLNNLQPLLIKENAYKGSKY